MTKLSAQVSVLLSEKKHCPDSNCHAVAASYQNKGTLKTMANIVRHRGVTGLYTGFNMHLCRFEYLRLSRSVPTFRAMLTARK